MVLKISLKAKFNQKRQVTSGSATLSNAHSGTFCDFLRQEKAWEKPVSQPERQTGRETQTDSMMQRRIGKIIQQATMCIQ